MCGGVAARPPWPVSTQVLPGEGVDIPGPSEGARREDFYIRDVTNNTILVVKVSRYVHVRRYLSLSYEMLCLFHWRRVKAMRVRPLGQAAVSQAASILWTY
jgi:hypothetical protein